MGDVAQAVGVSKTTISRYLHGEFGYMSPETKARIEAVISELGYRPNKMAQGLKATVSHLVGVTIADIGNPFSSLLLKGIQQECRARDVQLLVSDSNNRASFERANIESLLDAQVDGLIVNTVGDNDAWLTDYCSRRNHKPMVMLDRIVQPIVCDCVATDNHGAAFEMLDYLVDRGFEYVVLVMRPSDGISTRTMRREAVEQYFLDRGLRGEVLVYRADAADLSARLADVVGAHREERVCLFANNDESMRDVLEAMPSSTAGRVGVCAFADERWAKYSGVGITCLDQNPVEMGRAAARALVARAYDGYDGPYELKEMPARLCRFASTEC
ncbi:LacI family DNA-binding transcriptional regulator [Bifidobacterium myosotis]|uniref:LacI family DNA-binding transcriptional regulator n=2 Tax=Bifidobacterium myosotis TaxID=1630166 RepID=A0A5M9ZGW3_9BIFI|nr:LacI family DNA-binding transcriptional regulator [Bifidobacterium myosotis]